MAVSLWCRWAGSSTSCASLAFLVTFACGTAIAYSFMLLLTSLSVWMVRNQSLMEMWWLFSSLARYPKEIFAGTWAEPLGLFFTFFLPILLVVNVPAQRDGPRPRPEMVAFTLAATAVLALGQPAVLPARPAVVSQREQLNGPNTEGSRCTSRSSLRLGSGSAPSRSSGHGTTFSDGPTRARWRDRRPAIQPARARMQTRSSGVAALFLGTCWARRRCVARRGDAVLRPGAG